MESSLFCRLFRVRVASVGVERSRGLNELQLGGSAGVDEHHIRHQLHSLSLSLGCSLSFAHYAKYILNLDATRRARYSRFTHIPPRTVPMEMQINIIYLRNMYRKKSLEFFQLEKLLFYQFPKNLVCMNDDFGHAIIFNLFRFSSLRIDPKMRDRLRKISVSITLELNIESKCERTRAKAVRWMKRIFSLRLR